MDSWAMPGPLTRSWATRSAPIPVSRNLPSAPVTASAVAILLVLPANDRPGRADARPVRADHDAGHGHGRWGLRLGLLRDRRGGSRPFGRRLAVGPVPRKGEPEDHGRHQPGGESRLPP